MKRYLSILFFLIISLSCTHSAAPSDKDETHTLMILYTNDEHGHIYENDGWYKGVALYEMWDEEEKNCKGCTVLRISGGDNYTGTAVSTFFQGNSSAEVMKILGYRMSVLGNHEFDFGYSEFAENRELANMPYYCSNLVSEDNRITLPPAMTYEINGTKFLFAAAITDELKRITMAAELQKTTVAPPAESLRQTIENGKADINIIVAHESHAEAEKWIAELPIKPLVIFTGHDHKESVTENGGVLIIQNKGYLRSYAKVIIEFKGRAGHVAKAEIVPLKEKTELTSEGAKKIKTIIDSYLKELDKKAGEKLIDVDRPMDLLSFQRLYSCSVLRYFPGYDVAMMNPGSFRDSINKGIIKKSDILSMLPFDNQLILSKIKGSDLIYNLGLSEEAYCGASLKEGKWFLKNGEEIVPDKMYGTAVTDFIYKGGDGYRFNDAQDAVTSKNWRVPLEEYLSESSKNGKDLNKAYIDLMEEQKREYNEQKQ